MTRQPAPDRPRSTLRERNRLRTREAIESVALRLFLSEGFERTTVERIAEEAGVAPRTLFRYFPSKEDVVFPDHEAALQRLREQLGAAGFPPVAEAPLERLHAAVLDLQDRDADERQIARAQLVRRTPALLKRYEGLVDDYEAVAADVLADQLLAAGVGREEAVIRASLLCGALFGALRAARRTAAVLTRPDPRDLIERAVTLVAQGADGLPRPPAP